MITCLIISNARELFLIVEHVLCQILLDYGDFDEALNLLDLVSLEGIPHDVLLYNTILKKACEKVKHLMFPISPHTEISLFFVLCFITKVI